MQVQYIHVDIDQNPRPYIVTNNNGTTVEVEGIQVKWGNVEFFAMLCRDEETKMYFWRMCDAQYGAFFNQSPLGTEEEMDRILEPFVMTSLIKILKVVHFNEDKYYEFASKMHQKATGSKLH